MQRVIEKFGLRYIDVPFITDIKQALEIIQKAFPDKIVETINYDKVAQEGGLLNCTTWVSVKYVSF